MKIGKEAVTAIAAREEFKLYDSFIYFIGVRATRGDEWVGGVKRHMLGLKVCKRIKLGSFKSQFGFPKVMNIFLGQVLERFL